MGLYLPCTALFLPISLLHPHLPLFPLWACLCCTLPLPSTAPPSWSHLETEQVLWRDRGWLRKGISTQANDACSSLSSLCWNCFSAAARLKPDESRKHHRSRGRPAMVSCRWGTDCFECMHSHNKMLALTSAYIYTYWCMYVYALSQNTPIFQLINFQRCQHRLLSRHTHFTPARVLYIYGTIRSHYTVRLSLKKCFFFFSLSFSLSLRH